MRGHISPIGTRHLVRFIDTGLTKEISHVKISEYDKALAASIDIGLSWLKDNVFERCLNLDEEKAVSILKSRIDEFNTKDATFNQFVMESCFRWREYIKSKFEKDAISAVNYFSKPRCGSFGSNDTPLCDAVNISVENIIKHDFLLVEVAPGNLQKFIYIKHEDHYDYLPLDYILTMYPHLNSVFATQE